MNVTTAQPESTALTAVEQQQAIANLEYQAFCKEIAAMKDVIAPNTTDVQLALYCKVARKSGLDPFMRQIYAVVRDGKMTIQVGIDGLRLIADRSGQYEGQVGPQWCGPDGVWKDVWLSTEHPAAARVGVLKTGFREPLWAVTRWDSYVQKTKKGELTQFWAKMGDLMLAKCAESQALRKAFPAESQGLYTEEEMGQSSEFEDQSDSDRELGEWIAQRDRLFRLGSEKFDGDTKRRLALVGKFCEKYGFLARDRDGRVDLEGSTADQVRAAADALQAWTPEQKQDQQQPDQGARPETSTDIPEGELVDEGSTAQAGFTPAEQRAMEDEVDF